MYRININGKEHKVKIDGFGITYIDGMTIDDFMAEADAETKLFLAEKGMKIISKNPNYAKDIIERHEITALDPIVPLLGGKNE